MTIRSRHSSGTEIAAGVLVICVEQDSSRPSPGRSLCLMCGCVVVVCPPGRKGKSEEQSQWLQLSLPRSQRLSSVGAKRCRLVNWSQRCVVCGGRIIRRLLQLESESETDDKSIRNRHGPGDPIIQIHCGAHSQFEFFVPIKLNSICISGWIPGSVMNRIVIQREHIQHQPRSAMSHCNVTRPHTAM